MKAQSVTGGTDLVHHPAQILESNYKMAQTIEQVIASGDITIGALDSKSRIAPITRDGKPILITLCSTPELTTPFNPWPAYDNGERCSVGFRITPE